MIGRESCLNEIFLRVRWIESQIFKRSGYLEGERV